MHLMVLLLVGLFVLVLVLLVSWFLGIRPYSEGKSILVFLLMLLGRLNISNLVERCRLSLQIANSNIFLVRLLVSKLLDLGPRWCLVF